MTQVWLQCNDAVSVCVNSSVSDVSVCVCVGYTGSQILWKEAAFSFCQPAATQTLLLQIPSDRLSVAATLQ